MTSLSIIASHTVAECVYYNAIMYTLWVLVGQFDGLLSGRFREFSMVTAKIMGQNW